MVLPRRAYLWRRQGKPASLPVEGLDTDGKLLPGYRYLKGAIVRARNWSTIYGKIS